MPGMAMLMHVPTRVEAEVIIATLRAYGIYAHAPEHLAKAPTIPVNVIQDDLETARALLAENET